MPRTKHLEEHSASFGSKKILFHVLAMDHHCKGLLSTETPLSPHARPLQGTVPLWGHWIRSPSAPRLVYSLLSQLMFCEMCPHGAVLEFWEGGRCGSAEGKIHQQTGKIGGISLKGL